MMGQIWQITYLIAALSIIGSIKWLSSPVTARRGVFAGQIGMLLAVIGTLLRHEVVNYEWILISMAIGSAIGVPLAYLMPMTAVPQLTALSHAFGAFAAALVGTAEYYRYVDASLPIPGFTMTALVLETVLGYLTFHGQHHGFRQAAGACADAPDDLQGPEFRQPGAVCLCRCARDMDDRRDRRRRGSFPSTRVCRSCSECC